MKVQKLNSKNLNWKLEIGNWKFQNGFTLVELIIYMGLLSAFLLILTNIFTAVLSIRTQSQATSSVEMDGRYILTRLAYDINRATATTVPNATTLNLTIGGQTYTYSLQSSSLRLQTPGGTNNLNTTLTNLSGLTFQKVANPGQNDETIKIQFTLESVITDRTGHETKTFLSTVGRRFR